MSAISTIRPYTDEDKARVKATAERFCDRHGIQYDDEPFGDAETMIDHTIHSAHPQDQARLRKLWIGCYCRALRVPFDVRTTTGYGYIGVAVQ